jgi:hypothetical protein
LPGSQTTVCTKRLERNAGGTGTWMDGHGPGFGSGIATPNLSQIVVAAAVTVVWARYVGVGPRCRPFRRHGNQHNIDQLPIERGTILDVPPHSSPFAWLGLKNCTGHGIRFRVRLAAQKSKLAKRKIFLPNSIVARMSPGVRKFRTISCLAPSTLARGSSSRDIADRISLRR